MSVQHTATLHYTYIYFSRFIDKVIDNFFVLRLPLFPENNDMLLNLILINFQS